MTRTDDVPESGVRIGLSLGEWEALVARRAELLRVLGRWSRHFEARARHVDVEDVAQHAFARVWERRASFDRTRGSAWGWLALIAHRRASELLRRASARRAWAEGDIDAHAADAKGADELVDAKRIIASLGDFAMAANAADYLARMATRARTLAAKRAAAVPFGQHPSELAALEIARDLVARGYSLRAVVRELAARGVSGRNGRPFARPAITRLLSLDMRHAA